MFSTYQAKILRLNHQILVGNQPNLERNQHFRLFYVELPIIESFYSFSLGFLVTTKITFFYETYLVSVLLNIVYRLFPASFANKLISSVVGKVMQDFDCRPII